MGDAAEVVYRAPPDPSSLSWAANKCRAGLAHSSGIGFAAPPAQEKVSHSTLTASRVALMDSHDLARPLELGMDSHALVSPFQLG